MLIYREYGMTPERINAVVEWPEWICMLATALDEAEKADYMIYVQNGGKQTEWYWSNQDLAARMGGISAYSESFDKNSPGVKVQGMTRDVMGSVKKLFNYNPNNATEQLKGTQQEAVRAMGLTLQTVEIGPDGQPIVPSGYVFVPANPEESVIAPPSEAPPTPFNPFTLFMGMRDAAKPTDET